MTSNPPTFETGSVGDMKPPSKLSLLKRRAHMRFLKTLPPSLMQFPFETFLTLLALVGGLSFLTGPELLGERWVQEVGEPVIRLIGAAMLLSGATMAVGLRKRFRLALYPGLRLISFILVVYSSSDVWLSGWVAVPNTILLYFVAYLALARSIYLRSVAEVMTVAREIQNGGPRR